MSNTQRTFDGLPIDSWEARFSGSVDLDNVDALGAAFGDEILLVVTARVKQATIRETATGDVRRVQVYSPKQVRAVLNAELQGQLRDELELDSPAETLFTQTTVKQHVVEVTTSTTEIPDDAQVSLTEDGDGEVADLSDAVPVPSSPSTRGASAVEHDEHLARFLTEEAS